jgi:hypothetical protein
MHGRRRLAPGGEVALDVGEWLRSIGRDQHVEALLRDEIGGDLLPALTDADLRELGPAWRWPRGSWSRESRSARAREAGIAGEPPNLATRLQSLADPGQVVIAEATCRLLGTGFATGPLPAQDLKGLARAVAAFRLVAERSGASRFDAPRAAVAAGGRRRCAAARELRPRPGDRAARSGAGPADGRAPRRRRLHPVRGRLSRCDAGGD